MIELKFKVFNKKTGLMHRSHRLNGSLNPLFNWSVVFEDHVNDPDTIKLLYTGKHDKNGNEIYDGDLLKWDGVEYRDSHPDPYLVLWDEDEACWDARTETNFMMPCVWKDMIIVGNKFENPELLEEVGIDV